MSNFTEAIKPYIKPGVNPVDSILSDMGFPTVGLDAQRNPEHIITSHGDNAHNARHNLNLSLGGKSHRRKAKRTKRSKRSKRSKIYRKAKRSVHYY